MLYKSSKACAIRVLWLGFTLRAGQSYALVLLYDCYISISKANLYSAKVGLAFD